MDQPVVRARLLNVFGKIYNWLQLYDASEPILVEALELTRELHGEDSTQYADTLERLAQVRLIYAVVLFRQGNLDEAEREFKRIVKLDLPGSRKQLRTSRGPAPWPC
ncbi:MAG: tetratricopeptide repeat protein [Deltaproteobacteria bacterium]|nr:tetratricopeptide repeat protein [Deltaproteobacteria bacterium]